MALHRWFYKGGRPNRLVKIINQATAALHASGIWPDYFVTLEVTGRQSGNPVSFPLALLKLNGERYLVSMLGDEANWVRNVRAAGGMATLRHGKTERVTLEELPAEGRPAILKAYLKIAPGARPHIPVDKDAPVEAFEEIAPNFPVFKIRPGQG